MSNVKAERLTAVELSERWRGLVSLQTLANWRSQGRGPCYIKVGRKVLYPLDAVEEFEQKNFKASNDN